LTLANQALKNEIRRTANKTFESIPFAYLRVPLREAFSPKRVDTSSTPRDEKRGQVNFLFHVTNLYTGASFVDAKAAVDAAGQAGTISLGYVYSNPPALETLRYGPAPASV
jgi:hypothetical protein